MQDIQFWNNRAKKYGHTGWLDRLIYAYDQQARILAIRNVLNRLDFTKSLALDFGTGSGDFANLLSQEFENVLAFDITSSVINIAQQKYGKNKNINFICSKDIKEAGFGNNTVDIILSVTVIDCIMNDIKLIDTLNHFHTILKDNGLIIAFEYSLDYEYPRSSYQRFSKFEEWREIFSRCGFYLYDYYGFYHPVEMPCSSYLLYKSRISGLKGRILRLFTKYVNHKRVNNYLSDLANESIKGKSDFLWRDKKRESLIKIMIFKKLSNKCH